MRDSLEGGEGRAIRGEEPFIGEPFGEDPLGLPLEVGKLSLEKGDVGADGDDVCVAVGIDPVGVAVGDDVDAAVGGDVGVPVGDAASAREGGDVVGDSLLRRATDQGTVGIAGSL